MLGFLLVLAFLVCVGYVTSIERRFSAAQQCVQSHREVITRLVDGINIINHNQLVIAKALDSIEDVNVHFQMQEHPGIQFPYQGSEN